MKIWLLPSRPKQGGYTLTEVLIVLAVTSLMFMAVVTSMSGRQARTEFTQGVRDFEAKLENVISDVSNGGYVARDCTAGASGPPTVQATQTDPSGDCIFVGKALTKGTPSSEPVWSTTKIDTLVGRSFVMNGASRVDVTNLTQAAPVISNSTDDDYVHSFRVQITKIMTLTGNTQLYGFGFSQPFAGTPIIQNDQSVGSKGMTLYGLHTSPSLVVSGDVVNTANYVPIPQGLVVCLRGANNQYGEIRIGEAGSQSFIVSLLDTPEPVAGGLCYV